MSNQFMLSSAGNLQKRRKIHLDRVDCFTLAKSSEGSSSLTNPLFCSGSKSRKRYNLFPIYKTRKNAMNDRGKTFALGAPGFQSASDFHRQETCPELPSAEAEDSPIKSIPKICADSYKGQKSIASYFNFNCNNEKQDGKKIRLDTDSRPSSNIATEASSVIYISDTDSTSRSPKATHSSDPSNSQTGTPSKMYSPIKLLRKSSTIYVSDSDSSTSKVNGEQTMQKLQQNDVVKALFEGQRNLAKNSNTKKRKRDGGMKTCPILSKVPRTKVALFTKELEEMNSSDDDVLWTAEETTDSKFGLLGHQPQEKINYFDKIPDELLQKIFCQLPILDLCLNCNRVCIRWNEVISQEKFMKWKKAYYKLKKDNQSSEESKTAVRQIMTENGMKNTSEYLSGLIRYFSSFFSFPVSVRTDMSEKMQQHKKYMWAKALMEERLSDLIIEGVPNPWSLIITLVVISETVADVQEIVSCMSRSMCLTEEILEMLYCCASILLVMKFLKRSAVWNGMHYRLFYALYLFENSSVAHYGDLKAVTKGGQQSITNYSRSDTVVKLTHEQLRIVNHNVQAGEVIKIIAFAGTGKTTTLVRYTQMRPSMKFLLVVYNRSVCDFAKTKFPKNVECQTGHSLAFKSVGRKFKDAKKLRELSVFAITQLLPSRKGDNLFIRAKLVQDTLKVFFSSADRTISLDHTPTQRMNDNGLRVYIEVDKREGYVKDAEFLWEKMKDLRNPNVPMTHDGYLKLYQLYRPRLSHYDCILIDEAQDLTPAISDLLLSQPQAKILVGDPHQQIYSFRGAVNALQQIRASFIFYLTQSFRFGPEIAQVAAYCIEELKHEKKTLVGNGNSGCVYGETSGQIAVLCRCNFTVFSEAVKKCCYAGETNIRVAFVGGTDGFGFPMLQDLYTLMLSPEERIKQKRVIENKLVKKFNSFAEFEQFALKTNDMELLGKIKIVKTYHHNLPVSIHKILARTVKDLNTADMIFSTVHKAKGLEFNTVKLTDDFNVGLDFVTGLSRPVPISADEFNLLYVAVTRAKRSLLMTPTLVNLMKRAGEKYEFPVLSSQLVTSGVVMKCKETDEGFTPFALTLQKKRIVTSDGVVIEGGVYGPKILVENSHHFRELLGDPNHKHTQAEDSPNEEREIEIIIDLGV